MPQSSGVERRGSKGLGDCGASMLWFHFNRLNTKPLLADKANENKSLSSAQRDGEGTRFWYLFIYHIPRSTEDSFLTLVFTSIY